MSEPINDDGSREYTCALCKGTFETVRSDEEALAEAKVNFPTMAPAERSIVCDDCFKAIMETIA